MSRTSILSWIYSAAVAAGAGSGCDADPEPDVGSASQGGTSTSGGASSGSGGGPASTSGGGASNGSSAGPASTSGAGEGVTTSAAGPTGGALEECFDAKTEQECAAISGQFVDCQWVPTTLVADAAVCSGEPGPGACMDNWAEDGCAMPMVGQPPCEDLGLRAFVLELAGGGFEILTGSADSFCEGWAPFVECVDGVDAAYQDVCVCACQLPEA